MRIRIAQRTAAYICFIAVLCMLLPTIVPAQLPQCAYDRKTPSLTHARISFKSLNYVCAELELRDLLLVKNLSLTTKADAHVLLAAVYYAMTQDFDEKQTRTMEQFKEAFRAYFDWKGELDIESDYFRSLMRDARKEIEAEIQAAAADSVAAAAKAAPPTTTPATTTPVTTPPAAVQPATPPPTTDDYFKGKLEGEQAAKASGMWFFAGFCFGAIGVAIAYLTAPSPSMGALVGKSQVYINAYTEGYKSKCSSKQGKKALYGWAAACILTGVVYLVAVLIIADSNNDPYSDGYYYKPRPFPASYPY